MQEKNQIKRNKKKRKSEEMHEKIRLNEIQLQKEEMKIQEKRRVKRNTNEIEHKQCRLSKEKEETDHIVIFAVVII